jgi:non-specific serine/threonine protein kinase/serine/threonine-protein kinase
VDRERICTACGAALPPGEAGLEHCGACLVRLALDGRPQDLDAVPERIGPYRLIEKVGEGGMGVVYRAEQDRPVHRTVAVKLLRPGGELAEWRARFDAERQALALMDHPGIAHILDAGTTEDGRPFFVMEFVEGVPITTYCDRRCLDMDARLDLFVAVCDAVQHAHHKGVVHRDLKPSNVLVAERDGKPVVRIIDFGIAKAFGVRLTERTLVTQFGVSMGTPAYMSPEQASGLGSAVDTRTDVYALGVLLYELLTGSLPFDPADLDGHAIDEVLRRIREDDPPLPSRRVVTGVIGPSGRRRRDPSRASMPARDLRGDLDWIVMRALAKNPERRYDSPGQLAAELARSRANQPVLAGPPGAAYRIRKFVRRNRLGVAIAATALVLLLVATAGTSYGLVRALLAEREARASARTAERASEFLEAVFESSDPSLSRGRDVTAHTLLDDGVRRAERELDDEPRLRRRILGTMGRVYASLGLYQDAVPLLRKAVEGPVAADDVDRRLRNLQSLGMALIYLLQFEESEAVLRDALNLSQDPRHPRPRAAALARMRLGHAKMNDDEFEEARALLTEAFDRLLEEPSATPEELALASTLLAQVNFDLGDNEGSWAALNRAAGIARAGLPEDHPMRLRLELQLAALEWGEGLLEHAERRCHAIEKTSERVLGREHTATQDARLMHGGTLVDLGRIDEGVAHFRDYVEIRAAKGLGNDLQNLAIQTFIGDALLRRRDLDEAARVLTAVRAAAAETLGERSDLTAAADCYLAGLRLLRGDLPGYRRQIAGCTAVLEEVEDPVDPQVVREVYLDLAEIEASVGEHDAALRHLREAVRRGFRRYDLAARPQFRGMLGDPEFRALAHEARPRETSDRGAGDPGVDDAARTPEERGPTS